MAKLFPNMPPALEEYNPEDVFSDYTKDSKTFDENGKLHSYDDIPSTVEIETTGFKIIVWHSHGKIYRENKPSYVILDADSFRTYDNEYELHSFNDMPSLIDVDKGQTTLTWHNHGVNERQGDLPAIIRANQEQILQYSHYEQGKIHRANNQPASFSNSIESWYVKGENHNAEGHSSIMKSKNQNPEDTYQTWHLYNVQLQETAFNSIKTFEIEKRVPIWVAFLYELDVIRDTEISLFLKETGVWDETFPMTWVLKSWGITAENYSKKIMDLYYHDSRIANNQTYFSLKSFLEIAEFERNSK
jgi:hypothetical protein